MERSRKSKKEREKDSIRFFAEKIKKCEACRHLFNGECMKSKIPRHKNEIACYEYSAK